MQSAPDRKILIADAGIAVLGESGLRALTHRAVDARAGLPAGTCVYHHRTRHALLGAILDRIAEADAAELATAGDWDDPVGYATAVLLGWLGPARARARARARLTLMLDPEARNELGEHAERLAHGFVTRVEAVLGDRERARLLIALLDGLLADELIRGAPRPDPATLRWRVAAVFAAVDSREQAS
ncbi:TetR family transcriptional regulator [Longispora sp. K20-0274]|uniref:TetR/AcrR family transcriptional regulator n=1 Tax=Longispora sp. K20-0274 TaxID=3088255 RepID=UPI00399A4985